MKISNMNVPGSPLPEIKSFPNRLSEGIRCRDPFILPTENAYYLYRSAGKRGVEALVSLDLENWSEPFPVYEKPEDHPGTKDFFWAPECHYYKGNFYIFTSVYNGNVGHRTISAYRSASPLGPFENISGKSLSPLDRDSIDGTLYVDGEGQPWLVFVHEWTCMPDHIGAMAAAKLSDDLSRLITEPVDLFFANEPDWTGQGVTDGPFIGVTDAGSMIMTWSNFLPDHYRCGYAIGVSHSESGKITGPWTHEKKEIYSIGLRPDYRYDGGHAMMFYGRDGILRMVFHSPNSSSETYEHVKIMRVEELPGTVRLI